MDIPFPLWKRERCLSIPYLQTSLIAFNFHYFTFLNFNVLVPTASTFGFSVVLDLYLLLESGFHEAKVGR